MTARALPAAQPIKGEFATSQAREDAVGTARWRALEEKYMRAER